MFKLIVICIIIGVIAMIKAVFFGKTVEERKEDRERKDKERRIRRWEYERNESYYGKIEQDSNLPLREIWRQFLSFDVKVLMGVDAREADKRRLVSVMEKKQGSFSEWEVIYSQVHIWMAGVKYPRGWDGGAYLPAGCPCCELSTLIRLERVVVDKMLSSASTFDEMRRAVEIGGHEAETHTYELAKVIEKMFGLAKTFSERRDILSVCGPSMRGEVIDKMIEAAFTFEELKTIAMELIADAKEGNTGWRGSKGMALVIKKMCGLAETFGEWAGILSLCKENERLPILKKMVETATSYNDWSIIVEAAHKPYPYDNGPERPIWDLAQKKMRGMRSR